MRNFRHLNHEGNYRNLIRFLSLYNLPDGGIRENPDSLVELDHLAFLLSKTQGGALWHQ